MELLVCHPDLTYLLVRVVASLLMTGRRAVKLGHELGKTTKASRFSSEAHMMHYIQTSVQQNVVLPDVIPLRIHFWWLTT